LSSAAVPWGAKPRFLLRADRVVGFAQLGRFSATVANRQLAGVLSVPLGHRGEGEEEIDGR